MQERIAWTLELCTSLHECFAQSQPSCISLLHGSPMVYGQEVYDRRKWESHQIFPQIKSANQMNCRIKATLSRFLLMYGTGCTTLKSTHCIFLTPSDYCNIKSSSFQLPKELAYSVEGVDWWLRKQQNDRIEAAYGWNKSVTYYIACLARAKKLGGHHNLADVLRVW